MPKNENENRPDPTRIQNLATGYWNSAAFLAANGLDVFGVLGNEAWTAAEVAAQSQTDTRAMTLLLDACVGLQLLTKEDGRYRNTPETAAFLVPGVPGYMGGAIRWGAAQYAAWGRLAESVQSGKPAVPPSLHLGENPEQTRTFVLGMHYRALGMARGLLPCLDFGGATDLLDIGGGPGTLSVLLAQKYPELRATVLDLPDIVAIADELIAQSPVADKVQTRPGNAVTDADYGEALYDAVLISGVLHQMSPETIAQILKKAYRALQAGGRIVISDMMLDADKTQPVFSTLFSLQMLLTSEAGAVFSEAECQDWLEQVGFTAAQVQRLPPPLPYSVVTARKD